MEKTIVPSIIADDQARLNEIGNILEEHSGLVQLDIMDGRFVDNHSLDFDFKLPSGSLRYEAQLMVQDPEAWIAQHGDKVETVLAHVESLKEPAEFIEKMRNRGLKAGLALNPETPAVRIKEYLNSIHQVLVMTVHPGTYGAEFLPETLKKVRTIRKWSLSVNIEVDGGMGPDTLTQADQAGANLFVSGSYLVQPGKFKKRLRHLENLLDKGDS